MSEEEPNEEELKKMIDQAKDTAEEKRKKQAAKVGELKTKDKDTKEIEKVLEKQLEKR